MSECGRTPTNPNGYGGMDFTPPVTHPDYRDARIAELERQLAEAKEELDDMEHALANAEHWMGECSKLEAQLAEALEQNRVFRIAQKACVDCEGISHAEFQECKKDTERLDWLIEGKWEVYPSGRKYCIAHDIYDAVYGPDLRQAIDKAMEESE